MTVAAVMQHLMVCQNYGSLLGSPYYLRLSKGEPRRGSIRGASKGTHDTITFPKIESTRKKT